MNQFDFSKQLDKQRLQELFADHFKNANFVPFFGSGFSKGEKTVRGQVPDVYDFKVFMSNLICKNENFDSNDRDELLKKDLAGLGGLFWDSFKRNPSANTRELTNYLSDNFIKVRNISNEKINLLTCEWRYIYTLNYDDLIESAFQHDPDISIIIPYNTINEDSSSYQLRIFKIHGDAIRYRDTGNEHFLIISKNQYLEMLSSEENSSLNINMRTDFASNNDVV